MAIHRERWSDVKVGVFVLAALAVAIAGSLWIAGGSLFAARHVPYDVVLADSGGVVAGDRVRVSGVAVGRINDVVLRPDQKWPVLMKVSVKEEIVVHQDASALIATSGILGTSFLEIEPGSASSPRLPAGAEIPGRQSAGMDAAFEQVEAISTKLLGILDQTSMLLDQVSAELGPLTTRMRALLSEQNTENLEAILVSTRRTLDDVAPRVGPLLEHLDRVATTAEQSVAGVPALTDQAQLLIADLRTALGPDGQRLSQLLDGAQTTLGSADQAMQIVLENRASIEATLHDLELTMENLKAFSERVKHQPSSLVRSSPQQERKPGDPARPGTRDQSRAAAEEAKKSAAEGSGSSAGGPQ
jgi:phospholipid/cholesterol/gamma-HCH transport system substrate-binding protein